MCVSRVPTGWPADRATASLHARAQRTNTTTMTMTTRTKAAMAIVRVLMVSPNRSGLTCHPTPFREPSHTGGSPPGLTAQWQIAARIRSELGRRSLHACRPHRQTAHWLGQRPVARSETTGGPQSKRRSVKRIGSHELTSVQLSASLISANPANSAGNPRRNEPNHDHSDQEEVEPCR
jgi:hypothetical protein